MGSKRINWNQVFLFSKVAEVGSFKKAGEKLGISASTLSEHIKNLEQNLNVILFTRHHRLLSLTKAGSMFYQKSKKMFDDGQRMIDFVSPIGLGNYPINIGITPTILVPLVNRLIQTYTKMNSDENIICNHMGQNVLERTLIEGDLDFAISCCIPEEKEIKYHLIASHEIEFYVSKKISKHGFHSIFKKLPLLICSGSALEASPLLNALDDHGINPITTIHSDCPSMIFELCSQGMGIGAFSLEITTPININKITLVKKPRDFPTLMEKLYVYWTKNGENLKSVQKLKIMYPD